MHQDLFQLSGFPLLTLKHHPRNLDHNQPMVKNAENCWKSSPFCPFSFLDKEDAVEIQFDITMMHDFLASYYFDLKSKESISLHRTSLLQIFRGKYLH